MKMLKLALLVAMAAFYVGGGVNHFLNPAFYLDMMPPYIPAHGAAVAFSGVVEVMLGTLVLWRPTRRPAAWTIIAMLVAFLPVHVHMLVNSQLFPEVPVIFLWLRFPMQLVLGGWAYWYTLADPVPGLTSTPR
jgi:uncharacterized membrane protein